MKLHLWRIDPLVSVSFSALSCTWFHSWGISSLSVSVPKSESVIQSSTVYVLTFAFIVPVCPSVGFVSRAMSSEARQGGWDERFIRAHGVREEAEWELIRISLSKAITPLLTFHLTFFLNKSLLDWARQRHRESAWPWLGVVMHCWF